MVSDTVEVNKFHRDAYTKDIVWFFNVLSNYWSLILIYAGIPLAVCSVPQISQVFHWFRGEVDSAPTYLAAIFLLPSCSFILKCIFLKSDLFAVEL